jgi:hypothetical protein
MRGKHAASWSIATPRVRVILAVDRAWALLSFTWTVPSPLHSLVPAREQPRVTATIDIIEAWQKPFAYDLDSTEPSPAALAQMPTMC